MTTVIIRKLSLKKYLFFIIFTILYLTVNPSFANEREITDSDGRRVKIPYEVKRAVVLTPVCLESINYLGAIDRVAGRVKTKGTHSLLEQLIPKLKDIPIISESESDINIEKLLSLSPDIVIALGGEVGFRLKTTYIKKLEDAGVPVILITVRSLEDNYSTIILMGKIFNKEKKALDLVNYLKGIEKMVREKTKEIPPERKLKVLSVSGKDITTVLAGDWGKEDVRELAGGINVARDINQFVATVSLEKIIAWNPDVITISHVAGYTPKVILNNPRLKNIKAVKNKRVYQNPPYVGGLYTPKAVLILCWYAATLYPELGIDWVKITDEYYKKIYGISFDAVDKLSRR